MSGSAPLLSKTLRAGMLAALATPIDNDGFPDTANFDRLVDFVIEGGVDGVVVGGATGEYASFSLEERERLIVRAAERAAGRFHVLAGIGAQTLQQTLRLAETAANAGCAAVLLPMPYFFRYREDDLAEYCKAVCAAVRVPCLLYHLPSFTNPLSLETLQRLLESDIGLAGIKDSSGQSAHLNALVESRNRRTFDLFIGDDSLASDALAAGWNGGISGIACFLPELLVALAAAHRAGDDEAIGRLRQELDAVITEIVKLPIPWGVRLGLEARGQNPGPLPLPLSPQRRAQAEYFSNWCREWLAREPWILHRAQGEA